MRMANVKILGQRGQPFIRGSVVGLAGQADPGNDRAERDEQTKAFGLNRGQQVARALQLRRHRPLKRGHVQRSDQLRRAGSRCMQQGCDAAAQLFLRLSHCCPHCLGGGDVRPRIKAAHARGRNPFEILLQFLVLRRLRAAY